MLKECTHILQLSAKGENQEKALSNIAQIRSDPRQKRFGSSNRSDRSKDVAVVSVKIVVSTEKFLVYYFGKLAL